MNNAICDDRVVYAVSSECHELAQLYGELTGRRARLLASLSDVVAIGEPALLVAMWDQLRIEDLQMLYEFSVRVGPIGLLLGNSSEELRRRLFVSAQLAMSSEHPADPSPLPSRAVLGFNDDPLASLLFDEVSGPHSDVEEVARILRSPSSVLGFVGHSATIDARLSSKATLCTRIDGSEIGVGPRLANCDVTGFCHRLRMPREAAFASGALLASSSITARVLLMLSCYVGNPVDGAVHPPTGLLSRLLQNPNIGVIVASWEVVFTGSGELLALAGSLLQGETAGDALTKFYRSAPGATKGSGRYLLFGDPVIRVAPHQSGTQSATEASRYATVPLLAALRRAEAVAQHSFGNAAITDLLQSRLARLREGSADDDAERSADLTRASSALHEIKSFGASSDRYERVLRVMLACEGLAATRWFDDGGITPDVIERSTRCFGCGAAGRVFRVESRFSVRWLASCTHCRVFYADAPEGSSSLDAAFDVDQQGMIRHNLAPSANQSVLIQLQSPSDSRVTYGLDEPLDLSVLPPGRSWLWLYSLGDDGVVALGRMIDRRSSVGRRSIDALSERALQ